MLLLAFGALFMLSFTVFVMQDPEEDVGGRLPPKRTLALGGMVVSVVGVMAAIFASIAF